MTILRLKMAMSLTDCCPSGARNTSSGSTVARQDCPRRPGAEEDGADDTVHFCGADGVEPSLPVGVDPEDGPIATQDQIWVLDATEATAVTCDPNRRIRLSPANLADDNHRSVAAGAVKDRRAARMEGAGRSALHPDPPVLAGPGDGLRLVAADGNAESHPTVAQGTNTSALTHCW